MIIHCHNHSNQTHMIEQLIAACEKQSQSITLVHAATHLDIDTPGKDSYALFEAGLDFAMLVTDKQHYLKSRHNLMQSLPPPETGWVIQLGEVYPPDVRLTVTDLGVVTEKGKRFALAEFDALIAWLEECDEKRTS